MRRASMCSASLQPPLPNVAPVRRTVRVNIIGKSNGVGLARDIDLLAGALQASGHEVNVTIIDAVQAKRRRSPLAQFAMRARLAWGGAGAKAQTAGADINLMLEHVWLQYLSTAPVNVAVPNPEWFDRHDRRFLAEVDNVWAKTAYTRELFRALGCDTTYIGFDSDDRYERGVAKQRTYFHLAGKSTMKGTDRLVRVWQRHPEWPRLILVQHKDGGAVPLGMPNIDARVGYLSDQELRTLQNESLFHLCLSLTEGWGHYIVEAMGVGAVTITVDARPMNELVEADRGVLVPYRGTGTQRLATTYQFDEAGLEAAIERTIAMSDEECARLGARARAWFGDNKRGFTGRLEAALLALAHA
jgi:glycosyltransferase involved in cell wall biosynthesis